MTVKSDVTRFAVGRLAPGWAQSHLNDVTWGDSVERRLGFEPEAFGGGIDYVKALPV